MAGILGKDLFWWGGLVIGYMFLGHYVTNIVSDVIGSVMSAFPARAIKYSYPVYTTRDTLGRRMHQTLIG